MIVGDLKARLSHIDKTSWRYRLVARAHKPGKLDGGEMRACKFYWVELPTGVIGLVVVPIVRLLSWAVSRPIAWLVGYTRTGAKFMPDRADWGEDESGWPRSSPPDVYKNANVKLPPWRILLPAALFVLMLLVGFSSPGAPLVLGWLVSFVAVQSIVVYVVVRHRTKIQETVSTKWHEMCPPLVVEEKK